MSCEPRGEAQGSPRPKALAVAVAVAVGGGSLWTPTLYPALLSGRMPGARLLAVCLNPTPLVAPSKADLYVRLSWSVSRHRGQSAAGLLRPGAGTQAPAVTSPVSEAA